MEWGKPLELKLQGLTEIKDFQRVEKEHEQVAGPQPKATISDVADHIDHVAKVAGIDHVGIGSDFAGVTMPVGLEDVSRYPYLFAELIRRGWKDDALEKLAGANLVRVLGEAERVAARLRKERPPSTATFESLDGKGPEVPRN
jgi:membrane dipeptidase